MNQSQQDNDKVATAYQQQLHPWCLIQQLPKMQNREVARFRRRNDADAHLRALRQLSPSTQYTIVFDPALKKSEEKADGQISSQKAVAQQSKIILYLILADSALTQPLHVYPASGVVQKDRF